jgi:hypothetical protein
MLYGLLGRNVWETGQMHLPGGSAPFYGFYPVFAGLPLAGFGPAVGLTVLKGLQALLVSSTALIVYCWARRLVSGRWALTAAAMSVAMPALAYSGLIMTEATFLPATTLTLFLLARALAAPSWRSQVLAAGAVTLAMAIRLQGVGLIPAMLVAGVLMACFERDRRSIRRFLPFVAAVGVGLLALSIARFALSDWGGGSLGAYDTVAKTGFRFVDVLRWSFREAGDVFLLVVGLPLLATSALAVAHIHDRKRDRDVSALLAVALGYGFVTIVQIGAFASQQVHQLAERDLVTVAPPLFVGFAVWLGRGMPRTQPATSIVTLVVAAPAILLATKTLVTDRAVPDAFMIVPLLDFAKSTSGATLRYVWPIAAASLVALTMILPRRAGPLLAGVVVVSLVTASVLAQRAIDSRSRFDRTEFFGKSAPSWVDDTADGPVIYLDDGDPLWNGIWHQMYWNSRLQTVATLSETNRGSVVGSVPVSVRPDGMLLRPDGTTLHSRWVATPQRLTLVGERVRAINQGRDEPGVQLWRINGHPMLSLRTIGVLSHGGIGNPVHVTVYACGPGRLDLTLKARNGIPAVTLSAGGLRPVSVPVGPHYFWHVQVAAPPHADGRRTCVFDIIPRGNVISTRIVYERSSTSVSPAGAFHIGDKTSVTDVAVIRGARLPAASVPAASVARIGYCVHGQFLDLFAGQPRQNPAYKGATVANFVAGKGLTCDPPPPGFVRRGFATEAMHVPPGTYPYYAP